MTVPGYTLRLARRSELSALADIERQAQAVLDRHAQRLGFVSGDHPAPHSNTALLAASDDGRLWVAEQDGGGLVGFALVSELGLFAHLEELEVLPAHARRGLGSALLELVCGWAGSRGFSAVTRSALRDIEWNTPFFVQRGFVEIPPADLPPELLEVLQRERRERWSSDPRVLLQREV